MLVKQTVNTVLTQLDQSPALAVKLPGLAGLGFDHISLGEGRIRMLIKDNIVKVKVKIGKDWLNNPKFEKHPDVINM